MADETQNAADAANQTAERMADAARDTGDQMRQGAQRAEEALQQGGERVAKNSSQLGTKMIDQAESNAQQAFAAMRAAAGASDLAEVMKIQGDYLREQSQRSMTQAREIGELIMQFGREAVAPLRGFDPQR